jgi:transposase-like protein
LTFFAHAQKGECTEFAVTQEPIFSQLLWRWIQCYAPELSRRCRRELRKTNGSWRADETNLRVAGKWTYLYRAVDSNGDTIDFLLSPTRDAGAAKRFFQKSITVTKPSASTGHQCR